MDAKITLRKDKKNKNNEYPVIIQLSEKKEVARISLGINAKIEDFDFKNQKIKKINRQTAPLNDLIAQAKRIIELTEHHYKDIILHTRAQIKTGSEIEMFKKLYEKIRVGLEKDENYGVDLPHGNTEIEYEKDALVYEFDTTKRVKPINIRVSPKTTPENVVKIKRLANAITNNQTSEEIDDWLNKRDATKSHAPLVTSTFKKKVIEYLEYSKYEKKESTESRLRGHFKTLDEFAKHKGITLTFDSFDEQFGLDFKYYLEKNHKNRVHKRTGVSVGTVHNIQKNISAFLNWAHKKDYHQNLRFKKWKTFKPKTDLQYLTEDQMVKLRKYDLPENSSESRSRDLWLFMAYTGMRVSDMKKFKKSNVDDRVIKFVSQKANKACTVPLNAVTEQILIKYNYELPVQAESKILTNIKEILKKVGFTNIINRTIQYGKKHEINEMPLCDAINNHSARRSFINLMITKGVEVFQLSSMTGNTVPNLMVYYKTNEKQLVESLAKIDLQ